MEDFAPPRLSSPAPPWTRDSIPAGDEQCQNRSGCLNDPLASCMPVSPVLGLESGGTKKDPSTPARVQSGNETSDSPPTLSIGFADDWTESEMSSPGIRFQILVKMGAAAMIRSPPDCAIESALPVKASPVPRSGPSRASHRCRCQ